MGMLNGLQGGFSGMGGLTPSAAAALMMANAQAHNGMGMLGSPNLFGLNMIAPMLNNLSLKTEPGVQFTLRGVAKPTPVRPNAVGGVAAANASQQRGQVPAWTERKRNRFEADMDVDSKYAPAPQPDATGVLPSPARLLPPNPSRQRHASNAEMSMPDYVRPQAVRANGSGDGKASPSAGRRPRSNTSLTVLVPDSGSNSPTSGEDDSSPTLVAQAANRSISVGELVLKPNNKRPFQCPTCQRCFSLPITLQRHMRVHTGEKPFPCDQCSARFSQRATLKRHLLIHTGEKPFVCDICFKGFRQKSNFKRHRQMLHHEAEQGGNKA